MWRASLLLVLSLIIVAISEAKRKNKTKHKFSLRKFDIESSEDSGEVATAEEDCARCFKEGYEKGYKDANIEITQQQFPQWKIPLKGAKSTDSELKFPSVPWNFQNNDAFAPPNPLPKYPKIPYNPLQNNPSMPFRPMPSYPAGSPMIPPLNNPFIPPNPQIGTRPNTKQPLWRSPIISYPYNPQKWTNSKILKFLLSKGYQNNYKKRPTYPYPIFNYQGIFHSPSPIDMWNWVSAMTQYAANHNQHS